MTSVRGISWAWVAVVLGAATAARADGPGDAWAAAKGMLSADPFAVFGLNASTIKGSALFQKLYPTLLAQAGPVKQGLDDVRATCGIDVKDAVQGLVVAVDENGRGAIFLSAKGLDKGRVGECMTKMGAKGKKTFRTTGPDDKGIVEYAAVDEPQRLYVAYLPKGVIVIGTDPNDKALLREALSGHGVSAASDTGKALAGTNTGAALWGVVHKTGELDQGVNVKVGYGMADLVGGSINGDFRLVVGSEKEASDAVARANKEIDSAKQQGQIPPELAGMVKTLKIGCTVAAKLPGSCGSPEIQIKASLPESEAMSVFEMMAGGGSSAH
jgi:hypothetical protein